MLSYFITNIFICSLVVSTKDASGEGHTTKREKSTEDDGYLEIPGLGRQFSLGALYDAHNDVLIPAVKPWSITVINENMLEVQLQNMDAQYTVGESMESKFSLLDIGVDVKATILFGAVTVWSGSARILQQKSHSSYEASVTYGIKKITHYQTIKTSDVEASYNRKLIEQYPSATHVVTGITFGANIFFKFSKRTNSVYEMKMEQGSLAAKFKDIELGGDLKLTEEEKKNFSRISCEFAGDINPRVSVTNFAEALVVVGKMPSYITKNVAIPMTISLLPVSMFGDAELERVVDKIDVNLLNSLKRQMAVYDKLESDITELQSKSPYLQMPTYQDKIDQFIRALETKHRLFQTSVSKILPEVRQGKTELESELNKLLEGTGIITKLQNWIQDARDETGAIQDATSWKPELIITDDLELSELLWNDNINYIVSFVIQLYETSDRFTQCLQHNCEEGKTSSICRSLRCDSSTHYDSWLTLSGLKLKLRKKLQQFKGLVKANNGSAITSSIRYIMEPKAVSDGEQPDVMITIYEQGTPIVDDFTLPITVNDIRVESRDCTGTRVTWNIDAEQAEILDSVLVEYYALTSPDKVRKAILTIDEGEFMVPIVYDFSISITINCLFGVCSNYKKVFAGLTRLKECDVATKFDCVEGGTIKEGAYYLIKNRYQKDGNHRVLSMDSLPADLQGSYPKHVIVHQDTKQGTKTYMAWRLSAAGGVLYYLENGLKTTANEAITIGDEALLPKGNDTKDTERIHFVQHYPYVQDDRKQQWQIIPAEGSQGYCKIVSNVNEEALDLRLQVSGTQPVVSKESKTDSEMPHTQQWKFERLPEDCCSDGKVKKIGDFVFETN